MLIPVSGVWTYWQNHDGIYLVMPGSNSVYAGFETEPEAEAFRKTLVGDWKVLRHGVYKTITDEEAMQREPIRWNRVRHGWHVSPRSE